MTEKARDIEQGLEEMTRFIELVYTAALEEAHERQDVIKAGEPADKELSRASQVLHAMKMGLEDQVANPCPPYFGGCQSSSLVMFTHHVFVSALPSAAIFGS